MFGLMTLRLPLNLIAPHAHHESRLDQGEGRGESSLLRRVLARMHPRLRRNVSRTVMLLRNETGGLTALCDPEPLTARAQGGGRRAGGAAEVDDLSVVDDLVSGVVHEIRNPLTAIRMRMFSIQEAVEGDPTLSHRCHLVEQEISRLERLSQSFLEYVRLPKMRARPLKVAALLDDILEVLEPYLESVRAEVHRSDAPYVPPMMGDGEQLKQVFINLLTNAAEALEDGGRIHVTTDFEYGGSGGPMVVVRICDTGSGIPDAVRERILEPVISSKHRGKGIGLYIATRITENHGGRLSIESSPGGGSTIAVRIPAVRGEIYGHRSDSR